MPSNRWGWITGVLLLAPASRAADVMGVLSSDAAHYREAFQDFQRAYGSSVPVVSLDAPSTAWPPDLKVAVTFGSKAALAPLPPGVARVVCMAPALPQPPPGTFTRLQLLPSPSAVAEGLKEIQPSLQQLTVFWVSPDFDEYVAHLGKALKATNARLDARKLAKGEELSSKLGALKPLPQALWVPPDPALINSLNVSALLQYSSFNRIPFYSPTAQFVEMGSAAAVAAAPEDLAALAVRAARDFLAGRRPPALLSTEKGALYLNRATLEHVNLPAGPGLEKKAKTVY